MDSDKLADIDEVSEKNSKPGQASISELILKYLLDIDESSKYIGRWLDELHIKSLFMDELKSLSIKSTGQAAGAIAVLHGGCPAPEKMGGMQSKKQGEKKRGHRLPGAASAGK